MRTTLLALLLFAVAQEPPARPNIVILLADDMGFSDIGCYGSEIATPNLDRLAAGGLRFTQFYNTARCCPTRASLLTGLYPHQAGMGHMTADRGHDGYRGDLDQRCVTLAEVLQPAGYTTAMCGKWHVTKAVAADAARDNWPCQRGFDVFFGTLAGGGSYYAPSTLMEGNAPVGELPEDFYYTDALSERAAAIVREQPDGTPLFLYLAYTAPHWPLHAREADVAPCRARYAAGWDALRAARHARQIELGIVDAAWPLAPRDPRVPAWDDAEHKAWESERMAVYAAQVEAMDRGIGRLVDALRARGRLDHALFLFLADNGACAEEVTAQWRNATIPRTAPDGRPLRQGNAPEVTPGPDDTFASYGRAWANASNTPFRSYKHWVHEGGIATPLVVHWPDGIAARGELRHEPAHLIDVMATCVAVAGARYPERRGDQRVRPMEGTSLL